MANLRSLPDHELLRLLGQDDHDAYSEIYHRYFQLIYTHALKKTQDQEQAKDVTQDVFTHLWFKREKAAQIHDLAAYLFTAARNKVFDLFAHQQVRQTHLESLQVFLSAKPTVSADHRIREQQFNAYVNQEIQKLPNKMRVVFLKAGRRAYPIRK